MSDNWIWVYTNTEAKVFALIETLLSNKWDIPVVVLWVCVMWMQTLYNQCPCAPCSYCCNLSWGETTFAFLFFFFTVTVWRHLHSSFLTTHNDERQVLRLKPHQWLTVQSCFDSGTNLDETPRVCGCRRTAAHVGRFLSFQGFIYHLKSIAQTPGSHVFHLTLCVSIATRLHAHRPVVAGYFVAGC